MSQLTDAVRRVFFEQLTISALNLQRVLRSRGIRRSLVSIYQALDDLHKQGLLLKQGSSFHLSVSWLLDARLALEQVCVRALRSAKTLNLHALETKDPKAAKLRWRFSSLRQLNQFWVQLLFVLLEQSSSRTMLQYVPRLWFPHVAPERDQQYQRAFESRKFVIDLIVGGDSYLDLEPSQRSPKALAYTCYFAESPFHKQRNQYLCVIDDYLVSVHLKPSLANVIDKLFLKTTSMKSDILQQLGQFLDSKHVALLTVERGTRNQLQKRTQFEKYFQINR